MPKRLPTIAVLLCILLAFALRVIPAYPAVFTSHGVSFEEADAWFHMRTVHNLMAHFPRRSEFDPYAAFPGGETISTGPFWDYAIGTMAWLAGAASPTGRTVDLTGAWLPALLGALFPALVFILTRRLFDTVTALFAAFWVAIVPGTFLWVSHLGMADHHAAESFTSLLTLLALCAAAESRGSQRWILAALSGVALAAYLSTRAAGIFVPAIVAAAALLEPDLAALAAAAVGIAGLLFMAAGSASPWAHFTILSLAAGLCVTLPLAGLNRMAVQRSWSRKHMYGVAALVAFAAAAILALTEGAKIGALTEVIGHYLPWRHDRAIAATIIELQPLWLAPPGGFRSLFNQFGAAWLLAIPALGAVIRMAWRARRPALTLFAVWSLVMLTGVLLQLRMAAYTGPVAAILAGAASAWIVRRVPRGAIAAAAALLLIGSAAAIPAGFAQLRTSMGPDSDWWAALDWLRGNTPEPMGDPLAWSRWWPRPAPEVAFAYPPSAYSILTTWDKGWFITGLARRIPASNGEQNGAADVARFLSETDPEEALRNIRQLGARYVMLGPRQVTVEFPSLIRTAGRDLDRYSRIFDLPLPGGKPAPTRFFFPAFYRSMAARLYLFDGRRVDTSQGVVVLLTQPAPSAEGAPNETIQSVRRFASQKQAEEWMAQHPFESAHLASADPASSCVDLEELPWLRRVFASRDERIAGNPQPAAVKIFQLAK